MLKLMKAGFFTSIQDTGRFGLRDKGVPVSGTMDAISASLVNMLLDNDSNAAVIEITMTGPELLFEEDTYIALGGAEFAWRLGSKPVKGYKVIKVKAGELLSFGKLVKGFRGYLGIKGGFLTPKVLGSRSFYKPITPTDHLKDLTYIPYTQCSSFKPKIHEMKIDSLLDEVILEVYKGPEYELLTEKQLESLFSQKHSIAKENDRMAYQLHEQIEAHTISMLTSATLPGTVQLTPSGKLIILMKNGQTTGGYPRILQLSERAICVLAQKKASDVISFKLV